MSLWEQANPGLKDLVVYEPGKPVEDVARELGLEPSSIIKLASNENPLGPSPKAVEAMQSTLTKTHIYPDGGAWHLRSAIAERFGLDRKQVILGNGSNEIIEFAYHGFISREGDNAVASRYAFVVYKLMADLFHTPFREAPDKAFHHDLEAMLGMVNDQTKLLFVANPNNPTGTRIPDETLYAFLKKVPPSVVVVFDEAYYEFLENPPPSVAWLKEFPNLLILRTFSKIQGLAALRIGYGLCGEEMASILQRTRQPFNANALAQAAALAGFDDLEHQRKTKEITLSGRARLESLADELHLPRLPSEANFVTMKVGQADAVFKALMQEGIIVRSLTSYGLPEWIRVSIGTPAEMERFHETFPKVLSMVKAS